MMDSMTRARIESLLREIRSWSGDEPLTEVDGLARRYFLDPMMVQRIAESEGIRWHQTTGDEEVDPNQATQVLRFDEVFP